MNSLRHAIRSLLRTPGFTATTLATLALCLGANLAIFAVVDAILVRSLPFPDAGRLVTVLNSYPGAGAERSGASIANYFDRRNAIKAFSSVSIIQDGGSVVVGNAGSPNRVPIARVSPEFFSTLGVPLAMGHAFTDAELTYGPDEVAILTDSFWHSYFNADPNVVGRTFLNDGLNITVIGVLPRDFRFLSSRAQFIRPMSHAPEQRQPGARHSNGVAMIARLAPGATIKSAQAEIDAFNTQQLLDDPYAKLVKDAGYHSSVVSLHEDTVRDVKQVLLLLECGVLFLLLIGGVNLVNLLLIRANGRTKETAVRQALGAGRRHIAQDIIIETTVLAVAGGLLGLLLGSFGIELLGRLGTDQLPLGTTIVFDGRLAAISLGAAIVVGLALAAPVIWFSLHSKLAPGLQMESRGGTASHAAQNLRHGFIIAQVALSFTLLAGAGLLGVSLKHVLETPSGFKADHVLSGQVALPWKNYKDDAARLAFVERLLPALHALPGVTKVALTSGLPFARTTNDSAMTIEGRVLAPGEPIRAHYISAVSGDYWAVMGIPLLRGRFLDETDNRSTQRVCVVDQAFADRYWPGGDALGHRVATDPNITEENATTIVGVVATVKQTELAEISDHGACYLPYGKANSNFFSLVVRTPLAPDALAASVRKAILTLDPELPIDDLRPMQTRIDDSLLLRRAFAIVAAVFAGVALILAAIGNYGVFAYATNQRRREIGVRMALGALPSDVLRQFLGLGAKLFLAGLTLGIGGAWVAGILMRSMLFGVGSFHPGVVLIAGVVMSVVVLVAILLPSQRAARVNPLEALRAD